MFFSQYSTFICEKSKESKNEYTNVDKIDIVGKKLCCT